MKLGAQTIDRITTAPGRQDISAWGLCKWAYNRECVRYLTNNDRDWRVSQPGVTATALVMRAMLLGGHITSSGGTPGTTTVPDDAVALHVWLSGSVIGPDAWRVMHAAERGTPPVWCPDLPDLVCEPVMDETFSRPRPKQYYRDRAHSRPYLCPVCYRGLTDDEKASKVNQARLEYRRFVEVLSLIMSDHATGGLKLDKYRVTKIGVTPRPWQGGARGVLAGSEKT